MNRFQSIQPARWRSIQAKNRGSSTLVKIVRHCQNSSIMKNAAVFGLDKRLHQHPTGATRAREWESMAVSHPQSNRPQGKSCGPRQIRATEICCRVSCARDELLELPVLAHLDYDVGAADEFTIYVQLRARKAKQSKTYPSCGHRPRRAEALAIVT